MKKVYKNQFGEKVTIRKMDDRYLLNAHNYMAKRLANWPSIFAKQAENMPEEVADAYFDKGEKELGELCDALRFEIERRIKVKDMIR